MFSSKDIFLGKGGATSYQISRSVRLRSSASAYFNRTLSTPTSNTTWTLSCWLKRGSLSNGGIFAESTGYAGIYFASDKIRVMDNAGSVALETTAVYRDPSAWAHLVVRSNGTNIKAYWNSVEVGSYTGTITLLNAATSHFIGRYSSNYFDGYLTEINFIDGQQLTPSSFGETNTTTGVWGPTAYTGTYGTNGFYLNFSDNSAATAAAIGKDYSGNGNNWTPNNISVTAGATYDSMVDTPTPYGSDSGVGGEVRGNYAVLNPLGLPPSGYSAGTFAAGNLNFTTGGVKMAKSTMALPLSGKWYIECSSNGTSAAIDWIFGLTGMSAATPANHSNPGVNLYISDTAYWLINASSQFTQAGAISSSDIFQIAYDASTGKVWLGKNNTYYTSAGSGTGNPSSGTNQFATLSTTTEWCAYTGGNTGTVTSSINFGQRAFSYTAPSGYKALNTQNLPVPTINNGANYMAATTYSGNSASQSITNTVNSVSFQPDLVWVKNRSSVTNNYLWDSVRGALKELYSNLTSAEATNTIGLSAFNSNGFTLNNGDAAWNVSGSNYVGWQWKGGGTAVSNTSGSITSTVSANPTAGFSVVTYTGTGANATVGHGLGVAPSMIIVKRRDASTNWPVWHTSISSGTNDFVQLNLTTAKVTDATFFTSTAPTSSVFSLGTGSGQTNTGSTVAYCFAAISGYSAFGSYTGNGSADGTFVYLGFRPRFVLMKSSTLVTNWWIIDTARNTYNVANTLLTPSNNYADDTTYNVMDVTSNGFKIRTTYTGVNSSNDTYIYAAFAENPFKYALAR